MSHLRDIMGARDKCPSFVGIGNGSRRSADLEKGNGGGDFLCVSTGKRKSFSFPDALQGGGARPTSRADVCYLVRAD